jgi:hypothetical protein
LLLSTPVTAVRLWRAFYDRFFIIIIVKHSTRHRREVLTDFFC